MFTAHWGLTRSPFASQLNPEDFYLSATHDEALARLVFLIENGRRLGFLLGASGTGKSLLFEIAASQLRRSGCQVVKMNVTGLDANEFSWKLSTGLGHLTSTHAGPVEWWRGIGDRLAANRYQRTATVVLLDDVEDCCPDVYGAIARLVLTEQKPDARLTIILAGQRQQAGSLGSKLNELCELRIEIEPWDEGGTTEYVQDALERVGRRPDIFDPSALERLHDLSNGVARRVRQLAELSLIAGVAEGLQQIDDTVVDAVHLGLTNDGLPDAA